MILDVSGIRFSYNSHPVLDSDNFEAGARLCLGPVEFLPTLFYAKHKDLLTTVYDPRMDLSYRQNVGKATGYGVELRTNVYLNKHFTFFLNPTWMRLTYDEDLTFQGKTFDVKGNQIPDTPEWSIKSGMIFSWNGFEVIPMVRYLGKRYGDASHTESVDAYAVADLKLGYTKKELEFIKALKLSLEFSNIFDKQYVAAVNASDDARAGSTSYAVGTPFAALFTVGFDF